MEEVRRLHNACKRNLIQNWVQPNSYVLDCGCGRGGDIHKWNSVRNLRVVGVDPDQESLIEASRRVQESSLNVTFFPGDIRTAVTHGPFDVVCYNFALHYIVDSYDESVSAIGASVKQGGYLIGITPDRQRILSVTKGGTTFMDKLGNKIEMRGDRLMVSLTDGPYYAKGSKEEPVLDKYVFINSMKEQGFKMLHWEPMIARPNGLISDIYSAFVFVKQ